MAFCIGYGQEQQCNEYYFDISDAGMMFLVIIHKFKGRERPYSKWQSRCANVTNLRNRAAMKTVFESHLAKLPITEIQESIRSHSQPLFEMLPDIRMKQVLENMLVGAFGEQTFVITGMTHQSGKTEGET